MNNKFGSFVTGVAACVLMGASAQSQAQATVGIDPGQAWLGYMNVFETPQNGSGFVFGSGWGVPDLRAAWGPSTLTLTPNTIDDPNSFWYTPSGGPGAVGNKIMDANLYVETTGVYTGQTLTFSGTVLSNTLVGNVNQDGNGWTSVAFIKDFAPDYSSFVGTTVALTPGDFSISLALENDPGRHVQYGFATTGPNVWITDVDPYGSVVLEAVPEPATLAALGLGTAALLRRRRH